MGGRPAWVMMLAAQARGYESSVSFAVGFAVSFVQLPVVFALSRYDTDAQNVA
jgi:hypothetical protein